LRRVEADAGASHPGGRLQALSPSIPAPQHLQAIAWLEAVLRALVEEHHLVLTNVDVGIDAGDHARHHVGRGRLGRNHVETPPDGPHLRSSFDHVYRLDDFSASHPRLGIPLVDADRAVHLDDLTRRTPRAGHVVWLPYLQKDRQLLTDARI